MIGRGLFSKTYVTLPKVPEYSLPLIQHQYTAGTCCTGIVSGSVPNPSLLDIELLAASAYLLVVLRDLFLFLQDKETRRRCCVAVVGRYGGTTSRRITLVEDR